MSATNQPNQSRLVQSAVLSTLNSLVDNYFDCSICLHIIEGGPTAVIPECLHRFCDTCIKQSIQRLGAECPTCRARITSRRRDLRKDQLLEDIVSGLTILLFPAVHGRVLVKYSFVLY